MAKSVESSLSKGEDVAEVLISMSRWIPLLPLTIVDCRQPWLLHHAT